MLLDTRRPIQVQLLQHADSHLFVVELQCADQAEAAQRRKPSERRHVLRSWRRSGYTPPARMWLHACLCRRAFREVCCCQSGEGSSHGLQDSAEQLHAHTDPPLVLSRVLQVFVTLRSHLESMSRGLQHVV